MSLRFLDYRPMDETVVDVGNDGILHPQSSAANGALHIGVRQRERMRSSEVHVSGWLAYQNKRSSAYLFNFTTKWIASSFVPASQCRINLDGRKILSCILLPAAVVNPEILASPPWALRIGAALSLFPLSTPPHRFCIPRSAGFCWWCRNRGSFS
jgi:hypothetical protein